MAGKSLMCRRLFFTVAVVAAAAHGVSGQTATADGVAALARGDYQRAVEILRPIAEDWRSDDTAAQFFMAGLYEAGRGVPADPLRACALYARASSRFEHPFGRQAMTLSAGSIARGQEFNEECQLLANIGFEHGFEPVTFDLGPGHQVQLTIGAATVTYEGRVRREPMGFAQPGARFLPLHHTEVASGPARDLIRHFIEVFVWQPSGVSGPWNLQWHLLEVVRDQLIRIDTPELLVTAAGDVPPSRNTFEVREYAVVRVDDDGNAEWAVLKGPRTQTQRIESDAERREVRDLATKRDAAMNRVDWKRRYEVNRQPAMTYVDADGCGQVQVFGWSANRDEAIIVHANVTELALSTPTATFDLSRDSANISVEARVYDAPQRQFYFCSDVVILPGPDAIGPEVWRAVEGTVSIELSPPGIRARNPSARRATVTLSNVVLQNATGTTVRVPRTVRLTAIVRSMVG